MPLWVVAQIKYLYNYFSFRTRSCGRLLETSALNCIGWKPFFIVIMLTRRVKQFNWITGNIVPKSEPIWPTIWNRPFAVFRRSNREPVDLWIEIGWSRLNILELWNLNTTWQRWYRSDISSAIVYIVPQNSLNQLYGTCASLNNANE